MLVKEFIEILDTDIKYEKDGKIFVPNLSICARNNENLVRVDKKHAIGEFENSEILNLYWDLEQYYICLVVAVNEKTFNSLHNELLDKYKKSKKRK